VAGDATDRIPRSPASRAARRRRWPFSRSPP